MRSSYAKALQGRPVALGLLALCAAVSSPFTDGAIAATFDVSVTPPRFEKKTKPGKIVRDRVRITNLDNTTGHYLVKTADWDLTNDKVTFNEGAPQKGSCRPWVYIERHAVTLAGGASKSYRFEVHVPDDASVGECRFALLISPDPKSLKPLDFGQIRFPVVGRIAVVVYLSVGGATANLQFRGLQWRDRGGRKVPAVVLENIGNAHGRPFGDVKATDSSGRKVELLIEESPILPGRTQAVALWLAPTRHPTDKPAPLDLRPPLQIRGKIQWDGGSVILDQTLR
jgi:hypothetical protein